MLSSKFPTPSEISSSFLFLLCQILVEDGLHVALTTGASINCTLDRGGLPLSMHSLGVVQSSTRMEDGNYTQHQNVTNDMLYSVGGNYTDYNYTRAVLVDITGTSDDCHFPKLSVPYRAYVKLSDYNHN